MPNEPLSIIQEYLESPRPDIRRNATTALGVLGTVPATEALVRRALLDPDPDVREHAENVLAAAGPERSPAVAAAVRNTSADCGGDAAVYRLLGRLRNKGFVVPVATQGWRRRLQSIFGAGSLLDESRAWSIRFRPILGGLIWGLVSAFCGWLFLRYTIGLELTSDASFALFVSGLMFGPLVALAVSQRANPIGLQFDYRAAQVVELLRAAVAGAIVGALFALFVGVLVIPGLDDGRVKPIHLAIGVVVVALAVSAVRVGTLAVDGLVPRRRFNRAIQIAAGTAAGMLMVALLLLSVRGLEGAGSAFVSELSAGAVLIIPVLVSAAAAFTWIDTKAQGRVAAAPRIDRRLGIAFTALTGLVILAALLSPGEVVSGLSVERSAPRAEREDQVIFRSDSIPLGGELHFAVEFPQEVTARLAGEILTQGRDYVLEVIADDGAYNQVADDPPSLTIPLEPGRYHFKAYEYGAWASGAGDVRLAGIIPALGDRLASRMGLDRGGGDGLSGMVEITFALNSGPKNAIPSVLRYISQDSVEAANSLMGLYLASAGRTPGTGNRTAALWSFIALLNERGSEIFEISSLVGHYSAALWKSDPAPVRIARLDSTRAEIEVSDSLMANVVYTLGQYAVDSLEIGDALGLYRIAAGIVPPRADDGSAGRTWNTLCWRGALAWPASSRDSTVLAARWEYGQDIENTCELAVELMPEDDPFRDGVRDSRGVIRALMGDVQGAIEDFRAFVESPGSGTSEEKDQRKGWINRLEAGAEPSSVFTPRVLKLLRDPGA